MAKFIAVHREGQEILVNLDNAATVEPVDGGKGYITLGLCSVETVPILTDESYGRVRQMVATAQGGIPMDHSKMY